MFLSSSDKTKSNSDAFLVAKFKETGDLQFLGRLFEKYMHLIYGVCLKYLQDREAGRDATMHIFEKLIVEIPKREIEQFKPWLYVIAKNHCLMQLRSNQARTAREEKMAKSNEVFMEIPHETHHNDAIEVEEDLDRLKKCIEQLKLEQKECVKLFFLEQLCYQKIAEETQYELKKVKSYIQNGKRNLKICMERHA
jgi:RNA polymerase sigma-70 factor (ECF subfamily)